MGEAMLLRTEVPRSAAHRAYDAPGRAHVLPRPVGLRLRQGHVEGLRDQALALRSPQGAWLAQVDAVDKGEGHSQLIQSCPDGRPPDCTRWKAQHVHCHVVAEPLLCCLPLVLRPSYSPAEHFPVADLRLPHRLERRVARATGGDSEPPHVCPGDAVVEVPVAADLLHPDPAPVPFVLAAVRLQQLLGDQGVEAPLDLRLGKTPGLGGVGGVQGHVRGRVADGLGDAGPHERHSEGAGCLTQQRLLLWVLRSKNRGVRCDRARRVAMALVLLVETRLDLLKS
mmetsp:Transcript_79528/g.257573  ORF Transcript_79528/g.257573 Transcript_79528/m.257573 type:complete len:282 (+) Transcript_79528:328-1173(+)